MEEEETEYYRKALRYYKFSANQQSSQESSSSNLKLGDYYYYGLGGLVIDYRKAVYHYRLASDLRNAQATFNLGYMHQFGLGLPQDFYLAKRYYDQTVETDDPFLPVMLALIWLGLHFFYVSYLNNSRFEEMVLVLWRFIQQWEWDSILLSLLVVLLGILYLGRRQVVLERR